MLSTNLCIKALSDIGSRVLTIWNGNPLIQTKTRPTFWTRSSYLVDILCPILEYFLCWPSSLRRNILLQQFPLFLVIFVFVSVYWFAVYIQSYVQVRGSAREGQRQTQHLLFYSDLTLTFFLCYLPANRFYIISLNTLPQKIISLVTISCIILSSVRVAGKRG